MGDTTLGESVTDKIKVKVAPAGPAPEAATGSVTVTGEAVPLREAAADSALVVARAQKGSAFKVTGKMGTFTRVEMENGRMAFLGANGSNRVERCTRNGSRNGRSRRRC